MLEPVGGCKSCGRRIYCRDGFFDGVKQDGEIYCFSCVESMDEKDVKE